ncbi:arabinan endo-1,5-alpha-L-arabinosidase [Pontibacter diazotrophicus]|uniref:Arabinan endo-1,5-alpha-L-arabinosidase n=1 Tax=Pontibacter diazotrophicus TaxID=1400979 RepID=A0A3D8L6V9_9BACT|nr:arabinan endo-1,5-alpha-L-arabinosidase [Pontibacter diazotrophicus]RDV13053.1 arabinan endo-1,5-alpha-L-arabinosidase [Pontibacter diazotrophicus]
MLYNLKKAGVLRLVVLLAFLLAAVPSAFAQIQQSKQISVHDPVMTKQGNTYYLFATGRGIAVWSSKDMVNWEREKSVFEEAPGWVSNVVPGFRNHIWAPDIANHNGQYYLYYSVSAFGKNTSAIGVATNTTLDSNDPNYKWLDHGIVVQSVPGRDMWNAIDPNLILDEQGQPWLSFGSFWNGLKIVKLKKDLLSVAENPQEWHTVVQRERIDTLDERYAGNGAVEAPFIYKKGNYYYLFASFDYCCRGPESTYKMVVGRSEKVTGPYIDRERKKMTQGGGSLLLEGDSNWHGVGHNSVYDFDGQDYLVFHAYDAADKGKPKLRIEKLSWDKNGWPKVTGGATEARNEK